MSRLSIASLLFFALTSVLAPAQEPSRTPDQASASDPGSSTVVPPIYRVGKSVKAPRLIHSVDPRFSEEARKQRLSGAVQVGLYVDEKGIPRDVHVVRGVGHGLDEQAVLAVRQYRFAPATKDGVPVAVQLFVTVSFQI